VRACARRPWSALALAAAVVGASAARGQSPLFTAPANALEYQAELEPRLAAADGTAVGAMPGPGLPAAAEPLPVPAADETMAGPSLGPNAMMAPCVTGPPPAPGFQRSLGRFGPAAATAAGVDSVHAAPWDQFPAAPMGAGVPVPAAPQHDCHAQPAPFTTFDFSPDPMVDCHMWDGASAQSVYGGKHLNRTARPIVECFTPLYGPGPWPPSYDFLGPTNLVRPKFYVYGDFRTAVANNNNVRNSQGLWASRLNLDIDFSITATERVHAFWGPLDEGQQFTSLVFDDDEVDLDDHLDGFDPDTDALFFEGDLGYIVGGLRGIDAPFDLPFAVGLVPLVLQNGVWLEDGFVGAAATIPARNSPWRDWSNFDTTLFVGFDELTTPAFGGSDEANFVGATTFIERRGGYIELGWAYVDDPQNRGRSYHNLGLSYTRRYLNLVSNSMRLIVNAGQDGPESQRTADGFLVLMENSLLTPMPYNVVPYANFFAGFDRPQSLGRLQGPLKNTGINFESDLLTGYPILDDSANNTYGGAFGVDLLGRQFDRQLMLEAAVVQAFDDPNGRNARGDQYAAGVRYQRRLNHALILRADAMHGWLENSNDVDGVRVELRRKF
jgi:hypothetical protein